jgi:uncharacterized membrane protein
MKKLLIILPIIFLTGCLMAQRYNPQPIVVRELSTLPGAAKVGSLCLYAEDFVNHSRFKFSKANLKTVQLTLQNTSYGDYATTYQFYFTDFHGIGNQEYMPYPYADAYVLMNNSTEFTESVKGAAVGTIGGGAIGAAIGAIFGDPATGAAAGAVAGGAQGGFMGHGHYKASIAVDEEIRSRKMPDLVAVQPGSKVTGVLFFPVDTHTILTNVEGVNYSISIHNLEPITPPKTMKLKKKIKLVHALLKYLSFPNIILPMAD